MSRRAAWTTDRRSGTGVVLGRGVVVVVAIVVVAIVVMGWRLTRGDDGPDLPEDQGVVEWIFDGDTLNVTMAGGDERIRLLGIDTPEIAHPPEPADCYGDEARAELTRLLPVGTVIRLERDQVARDHYGRLLAYVYRVDDGLFVNRELVRTGFAKTLTIEPNGVLRAEFVAAATEAEAADVGLWAACSG